MNPDITALVLEEKIDPAVLEQLQTLREIRLGLALKNLENSSEIATKLSLNAPFELAQLEKELESKVSTLRQRLGESTKIYADEVEFYLGLMA
jgi:hypothetical protein